MTKPKRPEDYLHDGLPERATYRDTGCEAHPACLTCPFEKCLLEVEGRPFLAYRIREKERAVKALMDAGRQVPQIVKETGYDRRTVFRVRARLREREHPVVGEGV